MVHGFIFWKNFSLNGNGASISTVIKQWENVNSFLMSFNGSDLTGVDSYNYPGLQDEEG